MADGGTSIPAIFRTLFLRRAWPLWIRVTTVLAVLLLPLHVWLEGAHWQMGPVYVAILLLCYRFFASQ